LLSKLAEKSKHTHGIYWYFGQVLAVLKTRFTIDAVRIT